MVPELSDLASHQSPSLGTGEPRVKRDRQTDPAMLHQHPHTLLLPTTGDTRAQVTAETTQLMTRMALVLLVSSNGAEAEPGSWPWGGMGGAGGDRGSWGSSRVVDDVEFLPFLEAQVILCPGLVVVQGDEERHAPTCGMWRGPR